jgi:hypothetical protein
MFFVRARGGRTPGWPFTGSACACAPGQGLGTLDWESLYPNVLLQSVASEDSDHCPLLLGLNDIKPGKNAFILKLSGPRLRASWEQWSRHGLLFSGSTAHS